MTLDQFRVQFPEFRTADAGFVQSFLNTAATMVSATALGTRYDYAHGLKTADLIARSPGGVMAKMVAKDGTTSYSKAFDSVIRSKVVGWSCV